MGSFFVAIEEHKATTFVVLAAVAFCCCFRFYFIRIDEKSKADNNQR